MIEGILLSEIIFSFNDYSSKFYILCIKKNGHFFSSNVFISFKL